MKTTLSLEIPVNPALLPVATGFVENTARAFDLGAGQVMGLVLATEEIFNHLCHFLRPDRIMTIACLQGPSYVEAHFTFPVEEFDLTAFNLTASITPDDPDNFDRMGLFLAARSVDRFAFSREPGGASRLTLVKNKSYPEAGGLGAIQTPTRGPYARRRPDPAEIALLVELVNHHYPREILPDLLHRPGRTVDLIGGGEAEALAAFGATDRIGSGLMAGGILWRWMGPRTVELFGPYLFGQPEGSSLAEELLDDCLTALARTKCLGLVSRYPTTDLPTHHFQPLGHLTYRDTQGHPQDRPAFLRLMAEDPGSTVWSPPELEDHLRREYARLVLPREIRTVTGTAGRGRTGSVFSSQVSRSRGEVVIRPVVTGPDIEANLDRHLRLFAKENQSAVFFLADLGQSWQALCLGPALKLGFEPRLILPHAGQGDQLILQLDLKN